MKCIYCETATQNHPEGLHTWTGYVCRNSESNRFCNSRSTRNALCDECKDHQDSENDSSEN